MSQIFRHSSNTDRKSTRLNSSHLGISYAVFCLKKKKNTTATSADVRLPDLQHAPHAHARTLARCCAALRSGGRSPPSPLVWRCVFFFFNDTATTEIYTLSLHDALPI